jgi:hypothetical protein
MPPIVPDVVPDHFPAGTTVKFTRTLNDYQPSDGWGYTIYLNGLGGKFNKAASVLENVFQIQFDPTDTATLLPGPYRYAERLTNSSSHETYDITGDQLVINIDPNVSIAPAGAFSTWEEQQLAVVELALAGRLSSGLEAYQIAGRSVSKIPMKKLMEIRGILRSMIWRQNHPGQIGVPVRVEFSLEDDSQEFPPTWQDVTGLQR